MGSPCHECDDTGFVVRGDDVAVARRCACAAQPARGDADVVAAGVPRRYLHCTFDAYQARLPSQRVALEVSRQFAAEFPAVRQGLLFTGSVGTGKTHLAAAILRQVVVEQGVAGAFADHQDLLRRVQATWSRAPGEGDSEETVLRDVIEAEVLVLDDLGARRTTPWAEETIAHVLSTRYNEERTTIVTTNLLDLDADSPGRESLPKDRVLLSERVPERILSRLHEMCRVVALEGPDHRRLPPE